MGGTCSTPERNACTVLIGSPEGKRPLARPRRRWDIFTETVLKEMWLDGVD
jgi:hypothetical protein